MPHAEQMAAGLVDPQAAAGLLGVSERAVRAALARGRIQGGRRLGGRWVVPTPIVWVAARRGRRSRHELAGGRVARPDGHVRQNQSVHFSTRTPEWTTPAGILEVVVRVLGEIDLDPCADAGHNVPALRHFTQEDDGLGRYWRGRVFMNPPYGGVIGEWVQHLCYEYREGRTTEAIALVPARTDTRWFGLLADFPKCFVRGRLKFGGGETSAPFPSVVVYLGQREARFNEVFNKVGTIHAARG